MEAIDLLISARWIIPIEPTRAVLERHSLAIRGGRIISLLPTDAALSRYAPAEHVQRHGHVLMPGLVNAHTHAGMTLLRGAAENLPFDAWLKERAWPLEQRWLDPEFVRDGAELAFAGMLASGTTCFGEQYFFPEIIAQLASAMHIRGRVGAPIVNFANAWAGSAEECLDKALQLHDAYKDDPLIGTALAPHSVYAVGESVLERIRRAADEIDIPIGMHLHESAGEVAFAERPIALLERLGLLTPAFSAVHMTHLNADDIERVARTSINVVHCPQSNLKLDNGICPVRALQARNINIALGTDGAASNNDLDMFDELRTAALLGGSSVSAHDWLRVATLNGAQSLGLAGEIGSLQPGKWADLCCISLADVHSQPIYDVATAIVYSTNRSNVSDVWVGGRRQVAEGRFVNCNTDEILRRAQEWALRIQGRSR